MQRFSRRVFVIMLIAGDYSGARLGPRYEPRAEEHARHLDHAAGVLARAHRRRGLLTDEGYGTLQASNAQEAFAALRETGECPALMLLDIRMPGQSGFEVLQRLPKPVPFPVVVLSGELSRECRSRPS